MPTIPEAVRNVTDPEQNDQNLLISMRELSWSLHDLVNEEQEFLDTELARVSTLVQEGVEHLMGCFNEMHARLEEQRRQLKRSISSAGPEQGNARSAEEILTSTGQVDSYLGKAVRALQFEDIVQQMIRHSRQRISTVNAMLQMLRQQIEKLETDQCGDTEILREAILECKSVVAQIRMRLETDHPVNQESLKQGTVTLF